MKLKIEYLYKGMEPLVRKHTYDAGADIPMYKDIVIKHGKNVIPLGYKLVLPIGYAAFLSPRSSVMGDGCVYNMTPIDSDYSGEHNMIIYNIGGDFLVKKGERIAQLVIMPVLITDFVEDDSPRRMSNGIGSTGK